MCLQWGRGRLYKRNFCHIDDRIVNRSELTTWLILCRVTSCACRRVGPNSTTRQLKAGPVDPIRIEQVLEEVKEHEAAKSKRRVKGTHLALRMILDSCGPGVPVGNEGNHTQGVP